MNNIRRESNLRIPRVTEIIRMLKLVEFPSFGAGKLVITSKLREGVVLSSVHHKLRMHAVLDECFLPGELEEDWKVRTLYHTRV